MRSYALNRSGPRYDTRPTPPRPVHRGHDHTSLGVFGRLGQGAGSGFLLLNGSGSIVSPQGPQPVVDLTSLNGIAESLATGGLNGPLQIAGAAILFLAAGPCVARLAGLGAVILAYLMHSQGVDVSDVGMFASDLLFRIGAAADAFRSAQAA